MADNKLLKDLRWRLDDIRDMLMKEGFDGQRIYGCDEWSTPTVNLATAIGLIDKALASPPVAVQEEGDAWQDIATAPKTSRAILVWCPAIKCTFAVSWCDDAWLYFGGSGYLREVPTLWQPMVASPAMKGDQP